VIKYDLHTHSESSDGSDSPFDLLEKAKGLGLTGISITDHDTISAYTPELFQKAEELSLDLVPGVEFSTFYKESNIHLLGYFIDIKSPLIQEFCKRHKERRNNRNRLILEKLAKLGMSIDYEELYATKRGIIGRPHIAEIMIKKGYVKTIQEAFSKWIGDGKPGYESGSFIDIYETIAVIKNSGGKVVVAHPILIKKKTVFKGLCELKLDGWECYYARFSPKQNEEMVKIADQHQLIKTGGSDYHGAIKPFNQLGSAYTDEENILKLKNHA